MISLIASAKSVARFKFDDETVTPCSEYAAIEDNYGGALAGYVARYRAGPCSIGIRDGRASPNVGSHCSEKSSSRLLDMVLSFCQSIKEYCRIVYTIHHYPVTPVTMMNYSP